MNAADVLAEAMLPRVPVLVDRDGEDATRSRATRSAEGVLVAALLAHGEQGQGVTIEADGDLHPKDSPPTLTEQERAEVEQLRHYVDVYDGGQDDEPGLAPILAIIDRLLAEAGNTPDCECRWIDADVGDQIDGNPPRGTWAVAGCPIHDSARFSAEAGDTPKRGGVPSYSCPEPGCIFTATGRTEAARAFVEEHQLRTGHGVSAEAGDTDAG